MVERRVGRLLGGNSRAAGLFDVQVELGSTCGAKVSWRKKESWREWSQLSEGCYILRTNIQDWPPEELWKAYIQLTEAENAFRVHKNDLSIRPVWRQKEERVRSHILICFLAYVWWKTLASLCRQAGLGDEPRKVFQELSQIKITDVILPTRNGKEMRLRCVGTPTPRSRGIPLSLEGNIGAILGRILDLHWLSTNEHEKIRDPFIQSFKGLEPLETHSRDLDDFQLAGIAKVLRQYARLLPDVVFEMMRISNGVNENHDAPAAILSTVHGAKGREYVTGSTSSMPTSQAPFQDPRANKRRIRGRG